MNKNIGSKRINPCIIGDIL